MKHKIICGDCIEVMKEMESESVVLTPTDPPYFLPAKHYDTRKYFARSLSDLSILEYFFKGVFKEITRLSKREGVIYVFCDGQSFPVFYVQLYPHVKSLRPLVWDKLTSINGYSWRHQHELIIFAEMPKAPVIPTGEGDILKYRAVKVDRREHPAEKPIDLISALITKSSNKGDTILDPFVGSGITLVAAERLKRNSIGIEISKEYCELSYKRLKKEIEQTKLGKEQSTIQKIGF